MAEQSEHMDGDKDSPQSINQSLRSLYSAIEEEGIPPRFLELLEKLDAVERDAENGGRVDNADE